MIQSLFLIFTFSFLSASTNLTDFKSRIFVKTLSSSKPIQTQIKEPKEILKTEIHNFLLIKTIMDQLVANLVAKLSQIEEPKPSMTILTKSREVGEPKEECKEESKVEPKEEPKKELKPALLDILTSKSKQIEEPKKEPIEESREEPTEIPTEETKKEQKEILKNRNPLIKIVSISKYIKNFDKKAILSHKLRKTLKLKFSYFRKLRRHLLLSKDLRCVKSTFCLTLPDMEQFPKPFVEDKY